MYQFQVRRCGWVGGRVDFTPIIEPLRGPTCMLKTSTISTQVEIASWAIPFSTICFNIKKLRGGVHPHWTVEFLWKEIFKILYLILYIESCHKVISRNIFFRSLAGCSNFIEKLIYKNGRPDTIFVQLSLFCFFLLNILGGYLERKVKEIDKST